MHLSAVQSLILFLKRENVGTCLILSSRVFHSKLPRKDSVSSPKPSVLIVGSLHKFCILDCTLRVSFHEIATKVEDIHKYLMIRYKRISMEREIKEKGNL